LKSLAVAELFVVLALGRWVTGLSVVVVTSWVLVNARLLPK
jgi:hypothetical protein